MPFHPSNFISIGELDHRIPPASVQSAHHWTLYIATLAEYDLFNPSTLPQQLKQHICRAIAPQWHWWFHNQQGQIQSEKNTGKAMTAHNQEDLLLLSTVLLQNVPFVARVGWVMCTSTFTEIN